jgi:hypothetical protein
MIVSKKYRMKNGGFKKNVYIKPSQIDTILTYNTNCILKMGNCRWSLKKLP